MLMGFGFQGLKERRMEGEKDGRREGWKERRMEGWKDERMERKFRWFFSFKHSKLKKPLHPITHILP
jgi:predicted transposase YdaD